MKSTNPHKVLSGQTNIHSDVQMMLSPLTQNERSFLSSVKPLAIMHFEDSTLVASCAFLLELCGLSASMLRVDIAVLRHISSYYNRVNEHVSPRGTPFHSVPHESDFTTSLSQLLADDYMQHDHLQSLEFKDDPGKVSTSRQPSRPVITVLQHRENASFPSMDGGTCGLWLSSGNGDGFEFQNQQKEASKHWSLVTVFCQIHHLPLSTKYLTLLTNDNDWVGFLIEAQFVGFPIDIVIQVATQEFSDPRLKTHVLTVLKSMLSTRRKNISSPNISSAGSSEVPFVTDNNTVVHMELFGILAHCERQKKSWRIPSSKSKRFTMVFVGNDCFMLFGCVSTFMFVSLARDNCNKGDIIHQAK